MNVCPRLLAPCVDVIIISRMKRIILPVPEDIEREARVRGISVSRLCIEAGMAPAIFSRWKSGEFGLSGRNYRRFIDYMSGRPSSVDLALAHPVARIKRKRGRPKTKPLADAAQETA